MTDASPSPFRRFPWVQLVFCVACLTMTAWTWMQFSYCWESPLSSLARKADSGSITGRYVQVNGIVNGGWHLKGLAGEFLVCSDTWPDSNNQRTPFDAAVILDRTAKGPPEPRNHDALTVAGRVVEVDLVLEASLPTIDTTASRLHGASVAGIVVGSMGVFIFGLYLRRWVKERRAG